MPERERVLDNNGSFTTKRILGQAQNSKVVLSILCEHFGVREEEALGHHQARSALLPAYDVGCRQARHESASNALRLGFLPARFDDVASRDDTSSSTMNPVPRIALRLSKRRI